MNYHRCMSCKREECHCDDGMNLASMAKEMLGMIARYARQMFMVISAILGKSFMILSSITFNILPRYFFTGRRARAAMFLSGVTGCIIASSLDAHEIYQKAPPPESVQQFASAPLPIGERKNV